jgi:hypothetical protein
VRMKMRKGGGAKAQVRVEILASSCSGQCTKDMKLKLIEPSSRTFQRYYVIKTVFSIGTFHSILYQ